MKNYAIEKMIMNRNRRQIRRWFLNNYWWLIWAIVLITMVLLKLY